jgi:hypothetical protein
VVNRVRLPADPAHVLRMRYLLGPSLLAHGTAVVAERPTETLSPVVPTSISTRRADVSKSRFTAPA